jgi:hypothetical protein
MNRRTLLVPLYQMDHPQTIQFMELVAEPCYQQDSPYSALCGLGLDKAIAIAEQALEYVGKPDHPAALYWRNPIATLTQVEGISLAMALGLWAMNQATGYERIIVSGRLTPRADIVGSCLSMQSLAAVSALQQNATLTCLLMPVSHTVSDDQRTAIRQMAAIGIKVYPVSTLLQALHVCFSSP